MNLSKGILNANPKQNCAKMELIGKKHFSEMTALAKIHNAVNFRSGFLIFMAPQNFGHHFKTSIVLSQSVLTITRRATLKRISLLLKIPLVIYIRS